MVGNAPVGLLAGTLLRSEGDANVTNSGLISVGGSTPGGGTILFPSAAGNGILVSASGDIEVENTATGVINANNNGIAVTGVTGGVYNPFGLTGAATVTNEGHINAGASGNGVFVLNGYATDLSPSGGGGTISNAETGVIHAGGNGIQIGGTIVPLIGSTPLPAGGSFNVVNDGDIGTSDGRIGGAGVTAIATGNLDITNTKNIYANGTGINFGSSFGGVPIPTLGDATVTNSGTGVIDSLNGNGIFGVAAGDVDVTNNTGGQITAGLDGINVASGLKDATVTHGGSIDAGGSGIVAAAFGDVVIQGDNSNTEFGSVTATSGTGIFGLAGGAVTIDAGAVNSGAGAPSVVNVVTPPVVDIPTIGPVTLGGGVVGIALGGDAEVNLHGTVTTTGTFGATAISATGAATLNINGQTIDPPVIGGSAIVLGGTDDATIHGDNSTVYATAIALLGLNLGSGQVVIDMNDAVVGDGTAPNTPVTGVFATTTGGGAIDINGTGSNVQATTNGLFASALGGGQVDIDTGTVKTTVNGGILSGGISAFTTDGDANITTHGGTDSAGGFGVSAITQNGNAKVDLQAQTVNAANGFGMSAIANGGNADIVDDGNVSSANLGMFALAIGGDATINANNVTTTGSGFFGSAIVAVGDNATVNLAGEVNAGGLFGILGVATDGASEINMENRTVNALNGFGVAGFANNGNVDINALGSTVTSANNGISGVANNGNVVIDSNVVTTTGTGFFSSGVVGVAINGDVDLNLHGDITTNGGTFGALGVSVGGSGTVISDAGIVIDPPIGMAMVTIGSGLATVTNNATVNSTVIGLLGVNIGDGAVSITNSDTATVNAATGDGVVVSKIGEGNLANSVDGIHSVVVTNNNAGGGGGRIDAPNGAGIRVIAVDPTLTTGNNVLITNTQGATVAGAGGLLTPTVSVLADGDVTITNDDHSSMTNSGGAAGLAIGAASVGGLGTTTVSDVIVTNDHESDITGNMLLFATQDASVTNDRGSDWTFSGVTAVTALNDASILNDRGGQILGVDAGGLLAVVAGNDASITNDRGADMTLAGINASLMLAGNDASILNDRGGTFNLAGINANIMIAGNDATITNDRGGAFNLAGVNGNFMAAGNDASIANDRGSAMTLAGVNGNFMAAGNDASIVNDRGGAMTLAGVNGNFMAAVNNASITNDRGGELNLLGVNGSFMTSLNGDATYTNTRGGETNMLGANAIGLNAANGSATLTNSLGGEINMVGLNGVFLSGGVDASVVNSSNDGNNNQNCLGRDGICVNGVGAFIGTGAAPLNFNNDGGVVSMINQSSTVVTDAAGFLGLTGLDYPQYNTAVGDVLVIGGNFNGSGTSQLGVDAFLAGANNSSSDLMIVTGATSGQTGIVVNDLNSGPGALNLVGIPVVAVTSGQTVLNDFYIDPTSTGYDPRFGGVIDKGLFIYSHQVRNDPYFNTGNGFANDGVDHVLVGTPDREIFELTKIATAAQTIWHETTGTWLERQADLRSNLLDCGVSSATDMPVKARLKVAPCAPVTPGVWMKAVGSWTDRSAHDSFTLPAPFSARFDFDTSYKQNVFGFLGGVDRGRNNVFWGGDALIVGVLGGYLQSKVDFDASPTSYKFEGGAAGAYATYLSGRFFIDAIFKADFLDMTWNAPSLAAFGAGNTKTGVNSYGTTVDTGYRFALSPYWFAEPLATLSWVRTTIDNLNVLGTGINFEDSDSVRGSLGGRLGASTYWGATKVEASIIGRAWDEFQNPGNVVVASAGSVLPFGDDFKGAFGEVSGLLNLYVTNTGWTGFVRGGVKFNSDFTTTNAMGGVRYSW